MSGDPVSMDCLRLHRGADAGEKRKTGVSTRNKIVWALHHRSYVGQPANQWQVQQVGEILYNILGKMAISEDLKQKFVPNPETSGNAAYFKVMFDPIQVTINSSVVVENKSHFNVKCVTPSFPNSRKARNNIRIWLSELLRESLNTVEANET